MKHGDGTPDRDGHYDRRDLAAIKEKLEGLDDVTVQELELTKGESRVPYEVIYCGGMVDLQTLQLALVPLLEKLAAWSADRSADLPVTPFDSKLLTQVRQRAPEDERQLFASLFAGSVIVAMDERLYLYDAANVPGRQPEESTMEVSLRGPRDGFVERIAVNLALVRHRLRTPNLRCEYWKLGTESQTQLAVMHMAGIADPALVEEVRRRLRGIEIPVLHNATELETLISDRSKAPLFPLVDYVGRPDYVVQALMNGKVVLFVDGSPSVILAPTNLFMLIKSPEDAHLPFYYVSLERLLRVIGLVVSLCLPGFWVSLCAFNTDQIPFQLLSTVSVSREGLPLSASLEMFMMLGMFELFREAGIRLPRAVGQTVTVVGGLIVGDAAIRAGMTSPTMLVVAAVTAVSTFTLVNQTLNGSVTLVRLFILLLSSIFGIFGLFVGIFATIVYLSSLESFGRSYLSPIAPLQWKNLVPGLLQNPWRVRSGRRKP